MNDSKIIPEQSEGLSTDTISSASFDTIDEAKQHFEMVKRHLLNVNNWHRYMQLPISSFALLDSAGNEVERAVEENDYFKISMPVPENKSGDGYDWVQVKNIIEQNEDDIQSVSMVVYPAANPQNNSKEKAHFFDEKASSTFIVRRNGKTVTAEVHGRNMKANTETKNVSDKIRNAALMVAVYLGFSKLHWQSLVSGLMKVDE